MWRYLSKGPERFLSHPWKYSHGKHIAARVTCEKASLMTKRLIRPSPCSPWDLFAIIFVRTLDLLPARYMDVHELAAIAAFRIQDQALDAIGAGRNV